MSFVEIRKNCWHGGATMPDNIVRFNRSSIVLSPNLAENFQIGRSTTEAGTEIVHIGLSVDKENKQIRLEPNSLNAFSWIRGAKEKTRSLRLSYPIELKRMALERGDYQLIDRKNLVFQLAE